MMTDERAVRVRVTGRVQGVYFRGWTLETAAALGVRGWVRNEADGSVAALLAGPAATVERMLAALQDGPPDAVVRAVETEAADPGAVPAGFEVRR
jgi:acylphosphatase